MLTESFFYSTAAAEKATSRLANKDAGIFEHQLQPAGGQQQVYNRSATAAQCLAVSDSHVFAAQEHKAVVHVYERQKSSAAELAVFPDRICCLAVFAHGQIVVLGTAGGRILLWEVRRPSRPSSRPAPLYAPS